MPESRSLLEKESKLPAVVPAPRSPSTSANKRTGVLGALAVFAPLAVEVIYGLTRKWLAETTIDKPLSKTADKKEPVTKVVSQSSSPAGFRRRYKGSQN